MQYKFFKFNFAFNLYLENAKRYKIRNKKLAKIAQGGTQNSSGGGAKIFCALCAQISCASRILSRFARFLYLNFELLFLNFVKSFVPKNLPSWPKSSVCAWCQSFLNFLLIDCIVKDFNISNNRIQ